MKKSLLLLSCMFFLSIITYGQIINVPGDQPTIQDAINASVDGDTVLVADGLYYENIDFSGKGIVVASHYILDHDTSHITHTIINGSQSIDPVYGSVVTFKSGEDITSVLCGFTITGGKGNVGLGHRAGGGIGAKNSGGKVIFNKIIYNSITYSAAVGGGIVIYNPSSLFIISNNIIAYNEERSTTYTGGGGGIHIGEDRNGRVVITNNYIAHNKSSSASTAGRGAGGGIDLNQSISIIKNNVIVFNDAYQGGGIDIYDGNISNGAIIENNTIAYNHATSGEGGGIIGGIDGSPLEKYPIRNCILWGNTAGDSLNQVDSKGYENALIVEYSLIQGDYEGIGNIDTDPLFADTINYYLSNSSPCIDVGNPNSLFNDVEDPNNLGNPLFPALGTMRNDMGAYGGNSYMIYAQFPSFFIRNCSLNNTYQVPGSDTLIVTSEIFSPENQLVEVKSFIESYDGSLMDSTLMVDNGIYPDNIAGDGFYTGYWPVTNSEEDYNIHMSAYLSGYEHLVLLENAASFTTKGPGEIKDVEFLSDSVVGSRIKFNLTLENLGVTDSLNDITIDFIIPEDAGYKNASTGTSTFGDIAPGESKQCSRFYGIIFDDTCRTNSPYEIEVAIKSKKIIYWYDTLKINLIPTDIETTQNIFPENYEVFQNYPNPFNPSTKIKYEIPSNVKSETANVKLIVYDILGREVATLVDKQQKPGYYEVNWNAVNNSSGVYFYRITAGSFVEKKKMILLR